MLDPSPFATQGLGRESRNASPATCFKSLRLAGQTILFAQTPQDINIIKLNEQVVNDIKAAMKEDLAGSPAAISQAAGHPHPAHRPSHERPGAHRRPHPDHLQPVLRRQRSRGHRGQGFLRQSVRLYEACPPRVQLVIESLDPTRQTFWKSPPRSSRRATMTCRRASTPSPVHRQGVPALDHADRRHFLQRIQRRPRPHRAAFQNHRPRRKAAPVLDQALSLGSTWTWPLSLNSRSWVRSQGRPLPPPGPDYL